MRIGGDPGHLQHTSVSPESVHNSRNFNFCLTSSRDENTRKFGVNEMKNNVTFPIFIADAYIWYHMIGLGMGHAIMLIIYAPMVSGDDVIPNYDVINEKVKI